MRDIILRIKSEVTEDEIQRIYEIDFNSEEIKNQIDPQSKIERVFRGEQSDNSSGILASIWIMFSCTTPTATARNSHSDP